MKKRSTGSLKSRTHSLIGERPIARRVDDSVVRDGVFGPVILGVREAMLQARCELADWAANFGRRRRLKNTITLVVDGQAFMSQHIGDLGHYESLRAFKETIQDLISMYEVRPEELLVVHDSHPQYFSTSHALVLGIPQSLAVQHHRAHIASVLAERGEWEKRVVGVSFDGTGYGDDGSIWGGEIFVGSIKQGFDRVAHLRTAALPGGDAAAQYPVQAAAGFLAQLRGLPDLTAYLSTSLRAISKLLNLVQKTYPDISYHFDRASLRCRGRFARVYS